MKADESMPHCSERLHMVLDAETKAQLLALAKRRRESMSVVVRDLIRRAAEGEATP